MTAFFQDLIGSFQYLSLDSRWTKLHPNDIRRGSRPRLQQFRSGSPTTKESFVHTDSCTFQLGTTVGMEDHLCSQTDGQCFRLF